MSHGETFLGAISGCFKSVCLVIERLVKGRERYRHTHTGRERERESNRIFCHYGYWQEISVCHAVLIQGSAVVVLSGQRLVTEINFVMTCGSMRLQ